MLFGADPISQAALGGVGAPGGGGFSGSSSATSTAGDITFGAFNVNRNASSSTAPAAAVAMPPWALPVAIFVGALLLAVALKR